MLFFELELINMTLKYSLIFSALFAFSACGAKPEQKAKTQQVADTVVTSEQMTSAMHEVSVAEQNDTLPTYIDTYTKADSVLVCQLLQEFVPQRQQLTNDQLIIKIARKFIGVPYIAHTLDINEDEKLVINLHGLDCTTYVVLRRVKHVSLIMFVS